MWYLNKFPTHHFTEQFDAPEALVLPIKYYSGGIKTCKTTCGNALLSVLGSAWVAFDARPAVEHDREVPGILIVGVVFGRWIEDA